MLEHFFLYFDVCLVLDRVCKDEVEKGLVEFLGIIDIKLLDDAQKLFEVVDSEQLSRKGPYSLRDLLYIWYLVGSWESEKFKVQPL